MIEKFVNLENSLACFIGLITAFIILLLAPKNFYTALPFSTRDINAVFTFVIVFQIIFLLVVFVQNSISKKKREKQVEKSYEKYKKEENQKQIEDVKGIIDGCSDIEYSMIMHFLENGNKAYYGEDSNRYDDINLLLEKNEMFNRCSTQKSKKVWDYYNKKETIIMTDCQAYKLKDKWYQTLMHIYENTGSITHFPDRNRINPNQKKQVE